MSDFIHYRKVRKCTKRVRTGNRGVTLQKHLERVRSGREKGHETGHRDKSLAKSEVEGIEYAWNTPEPSKVRIRCE